MPPLHPLSRARYNRPLIPCVLLLAMSVLAATAAEPGKTAGLLGQYCRDCHDGAVQKGGLNLESLGTFQAGRDAAAWEKILRKLEHRQMPPSGEPRPDDAEYGAAVAELSQRLDRAALAQPSPGRTDALRRLNRTEYRNAIRDLLAVQIDPTALLPNDEPSHGFDNVAVGNLSPTLLDRYVSAAQRIARLAVGSPRKAPAGDTFRVRPDVTQEEHVAGLPLGTRGGILISHSFPRSGEYEVQVRLQRDRNEQVEGLKRPHEIEVLLDRERVALATVKPPGPDRNAEVLDAHLRFRLAVSAGPHDLGVTFPKDPSAVLENERAPFASRFNMHRHPRTAPAVFQVTITGPFTAGEAGDTPSRRLLFGALQAADGKASAPWGEAEAKRVLEPVVRRAYRRPVTAEDLARPLQFYRQGAAEGGGFEAGIERALEAVLVSPQFLFRIEADPAEAKPGTAYRISDLELASRLSFFLWSSLPDDALLAAAAAGDLRRPERLEAEVRRMLADERATNLVGNFAAQWLHLRGLEAVTPDLRRFIDFDDNLRQSMRRETELLCETILREDRPVTELISADYTFLDERLAKHYGVPHVFGSHFRRVALAGQADRQRGGLLRQGSILTVTSYATRTSPVIRGNWILANLIGSPTPPPPPNVPSLDRAVVSATLPMRERLAQHRENPSCSSCHNLMDPVGFALENYDAVGRWRTEEDHRPVDSRGSLIDGRELRGVADLEATILARPDLFTSTLAEKLLIFALGRGVAPEDGPAIREVVRRAQAGQFRFSAVILGIVQSVPFQMRQTP